MEVTFAAVMAACGGWFRQKILTRLDPVRVDPTPTPEADPFTRHYSSAEFQELAEPYRDTRHRLRAKIAKKRWKMNPAYMGMPRLEELDAVVKEAGETRTEFAVFWNHERAENDELRDLVKQEYDKLVALEIEAEDTRFEWLDTVGKWLDQNGALSLPDINSLDPEQWPAAVRDALTRHIAGALPRDRRPAPPDENVPSPGGLTLDTQQQCRPGGSGGPDRDET